MMSPTTCYAWPTTVLSIVYLKIYQSRSTRNVFMVEFMLSYGMVSVVLVDIDIWLQVAFGVLCKFLQITFMILECGNHKGNSVEKYHRFVNKTQSIAEQDHGSNYIFFQNAKTSQYMWNSALINNTNTMGSVATVCREFRFPIDMSLLPTPNLNTDYNQYLFKYLQYVYKIISLQYWYYV